MSDEMADFLQASPPPSGPNSTPAPASSPDSGSGSPPSHDQPSDSPTRVFDAVSYFQALVESGGAGDSLSTGFPSVDSLLGGGFRRGDLVVLGGDTGSGKSALALAMALRASQMECDAAVFSGELSHARLLERALAIQGRASLDALRNGTLDEAAHAVVATAALRLRDRSPVLGHLPPNGVSGLADLLIEYYGLELIVIDPLQGLATGRNPLDEELSAAVRELKALAVRRSSAVLLVSHLARGVRERPDPRPRLEDFGALGAIAHHADVVLGIYREELYDGSRDVDGAAEVHVLKNRGGATGYADLYFYKKWLRFEDMVEPDR